MKVEEMLKKIYFPMLGEKKKKVEEIVKSTDRSVDHINGSISIKY